MKALWGDFDQLPSDNKECVCVCVRMRAHKHMCSFTNPFEEELSCLWKNSDLGAFTVFSS